MAKSSFFQLRPELRQAIRLQPKTGRIRLMHYTEMKETLKSIRNGNTLAFDF